ncbi:MULTISPECIES: Na+/H+ antiporter subunit E [Marinobacter]|nr:MULTISPECIES: Na+/H+ antiporter subunit E [Marinobacter]MBD3657178.1 Na+/H+ antiporter subunit E [Marinobacter sp.]
MTSVATLPAVALIVRSILLLLVWWVLTLGDRSGLGFGVVVAVLVAWRSVRLFPPSGYRLRPLGALLFTGYFLSRSAVAGLDVARRLLSPSLPVKPGEITLSLRVPDGSPRWLLANTLSLMPGTLSALLEGDRLTVHCLDTRMDVEQDVREAERQVARAFGLRLPSADGAAQ